MIATYAYRDARLAQIDALLPGPELPAGASLEEVALFAQRQSLRLDRWQVADRTYLLVAADWLWNFADPLEIPVAVNQDPFFSAVDEAPLLTEFQAQSIPVRPLDIVMAQPNNYLDLVKSAIGDDQATFDQLLQAGHWHWLTSDPSNRFHPYDDVCVLLPVRLETIFDPPEAGAVDQRWKLALRVIPDEASIVRDSSYLDPNEQKWLEEFWAASFTAGLTPKECVESPKADIPWKLLAERVTPARAAWLVSIPVDFSGGSPVLDPPASYPTSAAPNRAGGMPSEMWVHADIELPGQAPSTIVIGRLPEDGAKFIDGAALSMPFLRDANTLDQHWLTSFAKARDIGLGGWYVLPDEVNPTTIATLYVTGSGDEDPAPHFQAAIDAGDFRMIRIGTPTNVVKDSTLPASVDPNWRKIASQRLTPLSEPLPSIPGAAAQTIARTLSGADSGLPSFPGADLGDDCALSLDMVRALWPALWGHWLRDIWPMNGAAYLLGFWMQECFYPEGPLMPARIGDQPYGLIPAIDLNAWKPAPTDDLSLGHIAAVLVHLATTLVDGRDQLLAARSLFTEQHPEAGNVVGVSTADYVAILGRPSLSHEFASRWFASPQSWLTPYGVSAVELTAARDAARTFYGVVENRFGVLPAPEPFVSNGYWWPSELPLVQPNRSMIKYQSEREPKHCPLDQFLDVVSGSGQVDLELIFRELSWVIIDGDYRLSTLPDSLLVRLLVYSFQLAETWRMAPFGVDFEVDVLDAQRKFAIEVASRFDRTDWTKPVVDPVAGNEYFSPAMDAAGLANIERAFRATLDSAAQRIDPWFTGFAWERLIRNTNSDHSLHRMGVYGWVDGPFEGHPGPTDAGLIHTPSQAQTTAALILRDNFLSRSTPALQAENGANPWQMDITSRKARLAREIADEVRFGFHIYEVIGRMVEEVVADHQLIRALRASALGMRPERADPSEVCNGIAAMNNLLGPAPFLPMTQVQLDALNAIKDALDTYADLLIADGIMQILDRQLDRAAETMDAAAGFSRPPTFDFLQTPPSGYQLDTTVVSVLPFVALDDPAVGNHPVKIADPSVAAFIESRLANAWLWNGRAEENGPVIDSVALAELGLTVCDAITLGADFLELLVRAELDPSASFVEAPPEHRRAQQLIATLGIQPAIGADLVSTGDKTTISSRQLAIDTAIYTDLLTRYGTLLDACKQLADSLESAADDATRTSLLRRALPWGVVPASQPEDRNALVAALLGFPAATPASPLSALCARAAETLRSRIPKSALPEDAPPTAAEFGTLLENEIYRKQMGVPDGVPSMARAIAALASPNAKLAVTATWDSAKLLAEAGLIEDAPDQTLDETWLTVVAAPRAPLARLEAMQLELSEPLQSWTNAPGNPWRAGDDPDGEFNTVARNLKQRRETSVAGLDTSRFVAVYGVEDAWNGARMAVGLIDAFGEAIPMPQRSTSAAFGFNAPAARPPQAILLGVPSVPGAYLDAGGVLRIVQETRKNALARAAQCQEIGEMQAVLPTSWLQANGVTRAHLEPWPLYEEV